jgi:aldose 1-epimerase
MQLGNLNGPFAIHGFVARTDQWQLLEAKADAASAWVTSRLEIATQPDWMKQWPFAHTIEMTYRLQDGVLAVVTRVINHAAEPMPIALGYHPYLLLTDSPRAEWTVEAPARTHWLLSDAKLPIGETEPADRMFPNQSSSLKDVVFDDLFSDLARDAEGRSTVSVKGRRQQLDIVLGANYRALVLYAPAGQEFICVEPMAGITDALNLAHRGVYQELQYVHPGATWQESFWVRPTGF